MNYTGGSSIKKQAVLEQQATSTSYPLMRTAHLFPVNEPRKPNLEPALADKSAISSDPRTLLDSAPTCHFYLEFL